MFQRNTRVLSREPIEGGESAGGDGFDAGPKSGGASAFSGMLVAHLTPDQAREVLCALAGSPKKGMHFIRHPKNGWQLLINDAVNPQGNFTSPEQGRWLPHERTTLIPLLMQGASSIIQELFPGLNTTPQYIDTFLGDKTVWAESGTWKVGVTPELALIFRLLDIHARYES